MVGEGRIDTEDSGFNRMRWNTMQRSADTRALIKRYPRRRVRKDLRKTLNALRVGVVDVKGTEELKLVLTHHGKRGTFDDLNTRSNTNCMSRWWGRPGGTTGQVEAQLRLNSCQV